jgi:hypothetical protein
MLSASGFLKRRKQIVESLNAYYFLKRRKNKIKDSGIKKKKIVMVKLRKEPTNTNRIQLFIYFYF